MSSRSLVDRQNDGVISPKSLQTLSLTAFSFLLLDVLESLLSEDVESPPPPVCPNHLRLLLGLETGSEYILSTHLVDQLLAFLSSNNRLSCYILTHICRGRVGCITRVNKLMSTDPVDLPTLKEIFQYPLLELSLDASNFETADWESLQSTVQHSPAYSSLQSLTLRYGNIDCFWSCRWLGKFQRLVHLDVQGAFDSPQTRFYHLKDDCPNLTILDISYTGIHHFSISEVPNLNVLNMAGVCFRLHPSLARDFLTLRHLVSLDISHSNLLCTSMCSSNEQRDPETIKILSTLVNLKCLDVSGCHVTSNDMELFDPPHHRMRFMGLLGTHACTKAQINSDVISGDANEQQLLVSLQTYYKRERVVEHALESLFSLAQSGHVRQLHNEIVQALLPIFERKEVYSTVLLNASGCLWYLTKDDTDCMEQLSVFTKKCVVVMLLKLMEAHIADKVLDDLVLKNCLLCMSNFLFPEDVMFMYSRLVKALVGLFLIVPFSKELIQSVLISLMNAVVWQVSLEQKLLMTRCGGIKASLRYIKEKIAQDQCDESLEAAWNFLWNVIDEAPENSAEYLKCAGLTLFIDCYKVFSNHEKFSNILENMVGVVENVAEEQHLRSTILTFDLLQVVSSILETVKKQEIQCNVAGIIVNLAMENDLTWGPILLPMKSDLLQLVVKSIQDWDLTRPRDLEYRSLRPVLVVAESSDDRIALWAVWALVNFCQVSPNKYLSLFVKEGGRKIIGDLLNRTKMPQVKGLAYKVLSITSGLEHLDFHESQTT